MAKFTVLQNNQRLMSSLGIYSRQNETTTKIHKVQTIFVYLILFAQMCIIIQSTWKLCDNSIQIVDKVYTCQVLVSVVQSVGVYLNMRLNVEDIVSLNVQLQSFVNAEGLHQFPIYSFIVHLFRFYSIFLFIQLKMTDN